MRNVVAYTLSSILMISLVLVGCDFDPREPTFDETFIHFAAESGNSTARSVSVDSLDQDPFVEELIVQLAGPSQSSATTASFELENESTTAVEGTHFNILSDGVTFDAGEHHDEIEVQILPDGFDADGEEVTIAITLTDNSDFPIMANFRTFFLNVEFEGEVE